MKNKNYGAITAAQAFSDAVAVNKRKATEKEVELTRRAAEFTRDIIGPAKDAGAFSVFIYEVKEINLLNDIKYILIKWGYAIEIDGEGGKISWTKK